MKHVGTSVDKFFRVRSHVSLSPSSNDASHQECISNGVVSTERQWRIGMHGGITPAHVKVVGAINVSASSWMPILQLTRYVI